MADILLEGIDNETRMKLLPREQELVKEMEEMVLFFLHILRLMYREFIS